MRTTNVTAHIRRLPSGKKIGVHSHTRRIPEQVTKLRVNLPINKNNTDYMADVLAKSSFFNNVNKPLLSRLMKERMKSEQYKDPVFRNISVDNKRSAELFAPRETDKTVPIVFVDTEFARSRRGNALSSDKFRGVTQVRREGKKFDSVPEYDLRTGKIEEGNHRVEFAYMSGYKTVPVKITGGWT